MAKTQTIRRRIKSVKNIYQITKAMELVSASKLKRAQEATLASRLYATSAREALAQLNKLPVAKEHVFFEKRVVTNELLIVVTSDRGLAGAYNGNVLKIVAQELQDQAVFHQVIIIGQKGAQFLRRLKGNFSVVGVYAPWPGQPNITHIRPIVATATNLWLKGEIDRARFIYTDFISVGKQQVNVRQLLPVAEHADDKSFDQQDMVTVEPSAPELLAYVLPRFLEVQMYQAVLEAVASEQAMRMLAMKNASDNAKDLTEDLTLMYNGVRQAAITQELSEITSGAAAVA